MSAHQSLYSPDPSKSETPVCINYLHGYEEQQNPATHPSPTDSTDGESPVFTVPPGVNGQKSSDSFHCYI